jgi:uncharacterized protein YndB with AHSA1/START domain
MPSDAEREPASEREIVLSRSIEGPVRLVFLAYTSAAHVAEWWGPDGFSITTHSFDFRVGGTWEFIMHGPDGTDYPNWIEWREIVPEERIVMLHGARAGDPEAFLSTVSFVEQGSTTLVTLRAEFPTKARRDEVVERFGAIEGGRQTLGRLAAFVARAAVFEATLP